MSLVRNFELELIVYLLEGVKSQMIFSSTGVRLNGMLRTKQLHQVTIIHALNLSPMHVLVNGLMRSKTLPSSKPGTILDKTRGCSKDGNHASFHMLMASSQPTLYLVPLSRTSLPFYNAMLSV